MPDAYVERLAAILRRHDGHEPPDGISAIVWGSCLRSTDSSGAWSYEPRRDALKNTLMQGALSSHERLSLYANILTPCGVRRNFFMKKELAYFKCYTKLVQPRGRRRKGALTELGTEHVERTGPYPSLPELLRNCDTRSHLTLLMDFMAHFCRPPYSPASILGSFARAYAAYRDVTADQPMQVSSEAGLLFFHAILTGEVVCRFDDDVKQFVFRCPGSVVAWSGQESSGRSMAVVLPRSSRLRPRKNARPGVIRPAQRALYRLQFLSRLGYRFVPASDQHRRTD